jgi:hypothetical protein
VHEQAVDYAAIAQKESLSGIETEMRKIETSIREIVDEMDYLKRRETRFRDTNGMDLGSFAPVRSPHSLRWK